MSVVSRPWSRLSLTGKIILPLIAVFVALNLALVLLWVSGLLPFLVQASLDTLGANVSVLRFLIAATIILVITVPIAFMNIFFEMKLIAFVNLRVGPNRIGPWGTLASVVHGLKVLAKEDFTPTGADVPAFTLAPAVVYLAAVMTLLVVPFAPGLFGYDMDIGLLYFFAVGGLGVVGLMMAGWSSYNKYSLLGGLRAAAGLISYELPLILSVMGIVLITGTLNLNQIERAQEGNFTDWFIFRQPLGALIFFIAATAEAEPDPVRPDGGRQRDRGRLRHRVQRHALRLLLLRRVREHVHPLGDDHGPVPGRLECPLRHRSTAQHPGRGDTREHRTRPRQPGAGPAVDAAHRTGAHHRHPHGRHLDAQVVVEHHHVAHRRHSCCSICSSSARS